MFDLNDISSITPMENIPQYDPRSVFGEKYVFPIHFSLEILDIFCSYVMDSNNDEITHSALNNTKTLFEILDKRPYYNNDSLRARIEFISLALEAKIDLNVDKKSLIVSHILRNCTSSLKEIIETEILKGPAKVHLAKDVSKYINTVVYEYLMDGYSVIYNQKLIDLFDKKETGGFKTMSEYTEQFKKLMSDLNTSIQDIERFKREGRGFNLTKDNIVREAKKIRNKLKQPSNKLRTGLQYLNKMLNGGFESGRSYLFIGSTGVGKSIVLLSVANWIRKYNKLPKKDGMKQAVLFISQENSQVETFERLFNINVNGSNLQDISEEEMIQGMIDNGMCVTDSDNEINFEFKEYEDKEIGVGDIDKLISDYEREGVEIIAVVQDYIEKLRPRFKYSELRHSLGCVSTELSELAKHRNIPVISAAQLNRTANSIVNNAIVNNKKNTIKLLGKENISESWDMMKNTDVCIYL